MISIRTRILLLMTFASSMIFGFGYLTITSYEKYSTSYRAYRNSIETADLVKTLSTRKVTSKTLNALKKIRRNLKPESRKLALSNVIQSYAEKNRYLLKQRKTFFVKNEVEFQKYAIAKIEYLDRRIVYHGAIMVGATLLSLLLLVIYIQTSVFKPLKSLSKMMIDFLNNKYTYKFTVPAPTEVGNLHATFNSLAQRVLGNMEDLKSLDKAKSEFLSIASHELRTPLTSIKGSLSLLNTGVVGDFPEPATNLISIAETESDRLIRLINDLLDLAKIEARKLPLNLEWESMDDLVESPLNALQGLAQSADVYLVSEGTDAIAAHVDKDRIQQVLTNLMSNAIKYSPPKGTVTIHCEITHDDQLLIEVTDDGKGIAPDDQELIFEQFRQATGPNNPLVNGTGLGLAIAKALVDEHGGEIGVRSSPREGSTFYFTLPNWKFLKKPTKTYTSFEDVA